MHNRSGRNGRDWTALIVSAGSMLILFGLMIAVVWSALWFWRWAGF